MDKLNKMEYKFANIQNAFDFLSILMLRNHSKWEQTKMNMERDNAHPNVRSNSKK